MTSSSARTRALGVPAYGPRDFPACNSRFLEDGYCTVQSVTCWTVHWNGLGQSGTRNSQDLWMGVSRDVLIAS